MLVLAPATCCLGGVAADQILSSFCKAIRPEEGSGGWVGLVKKWLESGDQPIPQNGAETVDSKPATSGTSSQQSGKRQKSSAKVCHTADIIVVHASLSETGPAMSGTGSAVSGKRREALLRHIAAEF